MKKIDIVLIMMVSCGFVANIIASQASMTIAEMRAAMQRAAQGGAGVQQAVGQKQTISQQQFSVPQQSAGGRRGAMGVQGQIVDPNNVLVSDLIWNDESITEDQKKQYLEKKGKLLAIINQDYMQPNWEKYLLKAVISIIDINKKFKQYCKDVVKAALTKQISYNSAINQDEKEAEINKQYTSITAKMDDTLRKREKEEKESKITSLLTQKDNQKKFNDLVRNIEVDKAGSFTQRWKNALVSSAADLIVQNGMMIDEIQSTLNDAVQKIKTLKTSSAESKRILVEDLISLIVDQATQEEAGLLPESVKSVFDGLLYNVEWDRVRNLPRTQWQQQMIKASKNAHKVLGISIQDIEKQIGMQLFFTAVKNQQGQQITPTRKVQLIKEVNIITKNLP